MNSNGRVRYVWDTLIADGKQTVQQLAEQAGCTVRDLVNWNLCFRGARNGRLAAADLLKKGTELNWMRPSTEPRRV